MPSTTPTSPLVATVLEGPTALVFGYGDPVAIVKELVKYADRQHREALEIKGAVLDGQPCSGASDVSALAKLGEQGAAPRPAARSAARSGKSSWSGS